MLAVSVVDVRAADPVAERFIRRGTPRLAIERVRSLLDANPDDGDLHAQMGSALVRSGFPSDGLVAMQFGAGSEWYELHSVADHADALRWGGRGREAAELRLSRRLVDGDAEDVRLLLNAADDLRWTGDPVGAEAILLEALALFPGSSVVHAALADVYLDLGDPDLANFHWLVASETERPPVRVHLVEVRFLRAEGDLPGAEALLETCARAQPRSTRIAALRAELLRERGDAAAADDLLEQPRWQFGDVPELMAVRAMVARDLGERDEAIEIARRARALFPVHPDVAVAAGYVGLRTDSAAP
jgi:tetratricopeptide (TPR) repeat protein